MTAPRATSAALELSLLCPTWVSFLMILCVQLLSPTTRVLALGTRVKRRKRSDFKIVKCNELFSKVLIEGNASGKNSFWSVVIMSHHAR